MVYRLTEFHVSGSLAVTIRPKVKEYFGFAAILFCHVLEIKYCDRSCKSLGNLIPT